MTRKEVIVKAFSGALDLAYDKIMAFIDESFDAVQADDRNHKSCSMTIPIKFTFKKDSDTGEAFHFRIMAKRIETECTEYQLTFNADQPELQLTVPEDYEPEVEETEE